MQPKPPRLDASMEKCYLVKTTETVIREYIVLASGKVECRNKFKEDHNDVEYLSSCDETKKVVISTLEEIDPDSDQVYKRAHGRIVASNEPIEEEPKKKRKSRKKKAATIDKNESTVKMLENL